MEVVLANHISLVKDITRDIKTKKSRKFMGGGGGGKGVWTPTPLENYKAIGFLSNTGLDPLENNKAIKQAVNVLPSSALQRNANYY